MEFKVLLEREAISARISASTKRQALAAVADLAADRLRIPPDGVLDALLEREELGSTGVGHGVAVPHARIDGLDRLTGVFVRLETPVAFEAVDDRPVDLLFALFAPRDAGVEHLQALARVSRLLRNKELREQLRKARTADAIYALLVRQAEPTAA